MEGETDFHGPSTGPLHSGNTPPIGWTPVGRGPVVNKIRLGRPHAEGSRTSRPNLSRIAIRKRRPDLAITAIRLEESVDETHSRLVGDAVRALRNPVHGNRPRHGNPAAHGSQDQVWINKLGYRSGEIFTVRLSWDPVGDMGMYTMFLYRENIETGERRYADAMPGPCSLSDEDQGAQGMSGDMIMSSAISAEEGTVVWDGIVPEPGLWQFVYEQRSTDMTQIVKKSYAKFVVTANAPVALGSDGTSTEIQTDTTWTNDTICMIRHQVFVNSGATLTIEPGTLILTSGQNAVIVVEKGGNIMAEGRRDTPIVMTCDAEVGLRDSGCWAGLILLGNAPMTRGEGRAEGVISETRPAYGGYDPMDSSGVLRYVRVGFAGLHFNPETQPNAFGFHRIGAGTTIDHIQVHEAEDDGIELFGGNANCMRCVSSGSKDDSLSWAFRWQGTAQCVYIHQDSNADNGIEAGNDSRGSTARPVRIRSCTT